MHLDVADLFLYKVVYLVHKINKNSWLLDCQILMLNIFLSETVNWYAMYSIYKYFTLYTIDTIKCGDMWFICSLLLELCCTQVNI